MRSRLRAYKLVAAKAVASFSKFFFSFSSGTCNAPLSYKRQKMIFLLRKAIYTAFM